MLCVLCAPLLRDISKRLIIRWIGLLKDRSKDTFNERGVVVVVLLLPHFGRLRFHRKTTPSGGPSLYHLEDPEGKIASANISQKPRMMNPFIYYYSFL